MFKFSPFSSRLFTTATNTIPPRKPSRKIFRKTTLTLTSLLAAYMGYQAVTDPLYIPRKKRIFTVYKAFIPAFLNYQYTNFRYKNDPETLAIKKQELDKKHSQVMYDTIANLKGLYIKLAQAACTRPDATPKAYIEALQPFLDKCPSAPFPIVEEIVKSSLNISSLDQVFSSFEKEPLGAASIAQVHGATLLDGTPVVVKIRYRDVKHYFDLDLLSIRALFKLSTPELLPAMDEVETMIRGEMDFRTEANSLEEIGDAVRAQGKRFKNIVVPKVYKQHSTDEVLIMERLYGEKLFVKIVQHYQSLADSMGITLEDFTNQMTEKYLNQKIDPNQAHQVPSQSIFEKISFNLRLGYAAFTNYIYSTIGWWLPTFLYNNSIGLFSNNKSYPPRPLPADARSLYRQVCAVIGFQIFELGLVNGDCHAGNIFLCDDGRIGLLDFGACKRLSEQGRLNLAWSYELLYQPVHNVHAIADRCRSLGYRSRDDLDYTAYAWTVFLYHDDKPETMIGKNGEKFDNVFLYQDYLTRVDPTVSFPSEFFLVTRAIQLLRGLSLLLGVPQEPMTYLWKDNCDRLIEKWRPRIQSGELYYDFSETQ